MSEKNLLNLVDKVFSSEEVDGVEFIYSQSLVQNSGFQAHSTKPAFLKRLCLIPDLERDCEKMEVILVDNSPYKTTTNPFFSSLYVEGFDGSNHDVFLKETLMPYLRLLSETNLPLWKANELFYPEFSQKALKGDWKENYPIWDQNSHIVNLMDTIHKTRFNEFKAMNPFHSC
jgi:hypothetical protein